VCTRQSLFEICIQIQGQRRRRPPPPPAPTQRKILGGPKSGMCHLGQSIHVVCCVGYLGSEYDRRMVIACVSALLQCFVCMSRLDRCLSEGRNHVTLIVPSSPTFCRESPRRLIYSYSSHFLLVCENCLLHVKTGRFYLLRTCVINRQFFVRQNENILNFVGTLCTVHPKLWFPNHWCTRKARIASAVGDCEHSTSVAPRLVDS